MAELRAQWPLTHGPLGDEMTYLIALVAFSLCNRPDHVLLVVLDELGRCRGPNKEAERIRIVTRAREALLKVSILGGLPRVRSLLNVAQCKKKVC